eukprot:CAMPEP_0176084924 /NCGR_PEP_ID=MMETSP0120_2-20121206/42501_1 /TAXON_ID=160619 /ORGANISM="Kryptoperidinium foliaceum, Strain CCMP 1326" /LENGTH=166 /DNA_ID=CAMNT_0017418735 /DNA_START=70 /DNA_END=566 /DNA_ORIENTATION=+
MPAPAGPPPNPQALGRATAGNPEEQIAFSMVLEKRAGVNLGVDVTYSGAASWTRTGVFVARVFEEGLVAEWNALSQDPQRVRVGDFLFQVNDVHGDVVSMVQEMKIKQTLIIHVLRRPSMLLPSTLTPKAAPTQASRIAVLVFGGGAECGARAAGRGGPHCGYDAR